MTAVQTSTPIRIQRRRTRGWRMPAGAIYVGRGSRWGNPWIVGQALARVPALDGSAWEPEFRISAAGMRHDYYHPGGKVTVHHVRLMTAEEVVATYRRVLEVHGQLGWGADAPTVKDIRRDLGGKDLACWCPLDAPCHADVLIELANRQM